MGTPTPLPGTPEATPDEAALIEILKGIEPLQGEHQTISVSPNGEWTATILSELGIVYQGEEYVYSQMTVASADGVSSYLIEQAGFYGLGYSAPTDVLWTQDGQGLYFANWVFVDGAGLYPFYESLVHLNLENGGTTPRAETLLGDLSFSPDETYLAYLSLGPDPDYVYLLSLTDNVTQVAEIDLESVGQAGGFAWAPDLSAFAFTAVGGSNDKSFIYRVEIETFQINLLYSSRDHQLYTYGLWDERGIIAEDQSGANWLIDPETGEATLAQ
jgi:hypothetical protein